MAKKKTTTKRATATKKKVARRKTTSKAVKKTTAKKKTTKKVAAKKATAKKKSAARKTTRKATTKKKTATKKTSRKKVTAKKKVTKTTKKVARKKVTTKKTVKKAAVKKTTKKTAAKKSVRKSTRPTAARKTTKIAAKAKQPAKAAARHAPEPKRPRRTKQAAPPEIRVVPPPVVDVTPVAAAPEPPASLFDAVKTEEAVAAPLHHEEESGSFGPNIGDPAPAFRLPDESGQVHSLEDYRGKRVVLYFYPRDNTPGCTTEACGFRDTMGDISDQDAVVLGVSPDSPGSHERFAQKFGLTFPLLADENHAVAENYGVWVEKSRFGRASKGIARTTFIINPEGRVEHVFRNVRAEGHAEEVLHHL